MAANLYQAANQLQYLHDILNTTEVKNALGIPLYELDDQGNQVSPQTPNANGVMMQSPYFLMTNFLPQLVINIGREVVTDEQITLGTTTTEFLIYYVMEYGEGEQTAKIMAQRLKYLAEKLLSYRTDQTYWYSMSFPTLEVTNEVHRFYEEEQIKIAVGRISFEVYMKAPWK